MSWFIGIDPSSQRVGLAALHENGELRTQTICATGEVPDRYVFLRETSRHWLRQFAEDGVWCVVVERPNTRHGGATLMGGYGVMVEAARSMLRAPVMTLGPQEVDKLALGRGANPKDRKAMLMAHARLLGYEGFDQDSADALCCADAARVLSAQVRAA